MTMVYNGRKQEQFKIKRVFDVLAAFMGIVLLFPVWLIIAVLIKVTSPGSIFFLQDRPGYKKKIFKIYKFRTMWPGSEKMIKGMEVMKDDTRVTKIGRFLRRTKLDETPQLFNVLKGEMSLVGPRPERVDSLKDYTPFIARRLDMKPGMTGLAQVSGNIYLNLQERYCLDVYYVDHFSLLLDIRILVRTIGVIFWGEKWYKGKDLVKVVSQKREQNCLFQTNADDVGRIEDYGYVKNFIIDKTLKKRVLITGMHSYIGESFVSYVKDHYSENFQIDTIDMNNTSWREYDFTPYDTIFHVAGIAHADTGKVTNEKKKQYYAVNAELAVETAKKARESGVSQFIFLSSIIIYGDSVYGKEKVIDEHTIPDPVNFYGDSKWQGDIGVRRLESGKFHVAVLRLPMIYGTGAKGNYPILARLARILPVFPDVVNRRSMLYIDNLCEFVSLLILSGKSGVYFPQNKEYVKTSEMVKEIAAITGKKVYLSKLLNLAVAVGSKIPGKVGRLTNKAFGSSVYDQRLSRYEGLEYWQADLRASIQKTEGISVQEGNVLFTIITVCSNSGSIIEKTICSVLHQTYSDIEYLIIDNESKDDTVAIAEKYKDKFASKGIIYSIISEPDQGIYDAMNKGIRMGHGEVIGFINAGDWYERDAVGVAAGVYAREHYDYFYADMNLIRADGSRFVKHSRFDFFPTSRHWNHPSSFAQRKLYQELGTFQCKGIHDDFDFFLRVRKAGKKIQVVNKVLANFSTGGVSNKKNVSMCRKRIADRYQVYRGNGYSPFYILECIGMEIMKYMMC